MFEAFDISSFLGGLVSGGIGGALLTLRFTKNFRAGTNGNAVDQSRTKAGGDVVGRDKKSGN